MKTVMFELEQAARKEFRCTLPGRYPEGSPGFSDPSARQGYYIKAEDKDEALGIMVERFSDETLFHIEEWKP